MKVTQLRERCLYRMNTKAGVVVSWRGATRGPHASGVPLGGWAAFTQHRECTRGRVRSSRARSARSSWQKERADVPRASDDLEPHELCVLLRSDRRNLLRLIVRDADEAPITSVRVGRNDLDPHGLRHEGTRQVDEIVDLSVARKRRI